MSFLRVIFGVVMGLVLMFLVIGALISGGASSNTIVFAPIVAAFCGLFMIWGVLLSISNKLSQLIALQRPSPAKLDSEREPMPAVPPN